MKRHIIAVICILLVGGFPDFAYALEGSGTGVEESLNNLLGFFFGGRGGYIVIALGAVIVVCSIIFGGLSKSWTTAVNFIIGGGILFGLGGILQFFFDVNVDSLLLP